MSRRGIHPLLMGMDKPERKPVEPSKANDLSATNPLNASGSSVPRKKIQATSRLLDQFMNK